MSGLWEEMIISVFFFFLTIGVATMVDFADMAFGVALDLKVIEPWANSLTSEAPCPNS